MGTANIKRTLPVIGWREWVQLPELSTTRVKAKIDTGARTSSLHAIHLQTFDRDGKTFVRFQFHPLQRNTELTAKAEAEVLEFRSVRSSNGHVSRRPVIITPITLHGQTWNVELTLANRDEMGFRMLLGREALRDRFLVDSGRSYVSGNARDSQSAEPGTSSSG